MLNDAAVAEIPPKLAAELKKLDRLVESSKGKYEEATKRRAELIVRASEIASGRKVADLLGLSQGRVQQIIKRHEAKQR